MILKICYRLWQIEVKYMFIGNVSSSCWFRVLGVKENIIIFFEQEKYQGNVILI